MTFGHKDRQKSVCKLIASFMAVRLSKCQMMDVSLSDYYFMMKQQAANGKKLKSWIEMNKELCKDFLLVKTSFFRMVIQYTMRKQP